ncbi:MAG: cation diffusion facilitator family transporter, partial [Flavobacteriales bacterium]
LVAGGRHLITDAYASAAVIAGLFVIWLTGLLWLDNLIAMIFGGFIFYTGIRIIRKSIGGIMDEANMKLIEELISVIREDRRENWIDVHNFRVITYGQTLHIDCHFTMPWYKTLKEIHKETEVFERHVNERFGRKIEFFIHPEHCRPQSCQICMMQNCHERAHAFEKKLDWTPAQLFPNKQHNITS